MKVVPALLGLAAAGVFAAAQPAAAQQVEVHVTSATAGAARFTVEGTGGSILTRSAAVHVREVDGDRVTVITAPATITLPADAVFSLRLVAADDDALRVSTTGSAVPGADRTIIEGSRIGFVRSRRGGTIELVELIGTVTVRPRG